MAQETCRQGSQHGSRRNWADRSLPSFTSFSAWHPYTSDKISHWHKEETTFHFWPLGGSLPSVVTPHRNVLGVLIRAPKNASYGP